MTVLLIASTMYQAMSLAAAADAGLLTADPDEERILLLANSSQVPEVTPRLQDNPGFDRLAGRFDRVLDLGALIYPRRPQQFSPAHEDLRMWQRLLRSHWSLGSEPVKLVLDSVHVNPGIALARIFSDATLTVHSDGLMVYGPTRTALGLDISQRLDALLYLDLVPGVHPQLLREHRVGTRAIPLNALRTVIDELTAAQGQDLNTLVLAGGYGGYGGYGGDEASTGRGIARKGTNQTDTEGSNPLEGTTALILGQYLTELRLISRSEEADLHRGMLQAAAERGVQRCVFKPHPSAGRTATHELAAVAADLNIGFAVVDAAIPAELLMARLRPGVVIGAFSTAMATARFLFGIETLAVGTELLLERLSPYENSNRIPVTIIDALLVHGRGAGHGTGSGSGSTDGTVRPGARQLQPLLDAVAYCMQAENLAPLRPQVMHYLDGVSGAELSRYFKRRRLTALGLPGSLPAGRRGLVLARKLPPPVRRLAHRVVAALPS